jgi:hypothetical protein
MNTKKIFITSILVCLIVAAFAITAGDAKKISMFGYKSEVSGVKLIVDTGVARLRGEEKYIPLLIWLGHSEKKTMHADRESFTLIDSEGNSYPLPAYDEVLKNYGSNLISFDYELARKMDDYGAMDFLSCRFLRRIEFFPNPSSMSIMYDNVELPSRSFFQALLYFPNKAGKSTGTYKLVYEDKKSGVKIEVPFKVDWMK